MTSTPLRLGLVFGGASGEHAVSIRSAATVAAGLRSGANVERYHLLCFYIDRQGRWWPPAVAEEVLRSGVPAEASDLPGDGPPGFRGLPEGALEVEEEEVDEDAEADGLAEPDTVSVGEPE